MPRPGRRHGHSPFNTACGQLKSLARRVYADDEDNKNAVTGLVDTIERLVDNEDYVEGGYDPFKDLATKIRDQHPKVWEGDSQNNGRRLLQQYL